MRTSQLIRQYVLGANEGGRQLGQTERTKAVAFATEGMGEGLGTFLGRRSGEYGGSTLGFDVRPLLGGGGVSTRVFKILLEMELRTVTELECVVCGRVFKT